MPNKVFVIQENGHSFKEAEKYGQIVVLFPGKVNVFATDALLRDVNEKMGDAGEDDFLCLSGNSTAGCMAYAHLMRQFGRVNLLLYSFSRNEYEVRTIRDQ